MKLILCADDYAQSTDIDDAIIKLIQQKRLSATSCMTLSPHWKASAKRITPNIRKQAAIGLHLDFTHFGKAYSHPKLIALSYLRLLSKKDIALRIQAQLDLFEEALGTPPDYVDGHQHVHQLPKIREVLIDVLSKRYRSNLPWLRIARPPAAAGFKSWVIGLLGANALERQAQQAELNYSDCLLGVYGFDVGVEGYTLLMNEWLSNLKNRNHILPPVLMCHPSTTSTDQDAIYKARLNEFEVLNNVKFDALLNTHQIELVKAPS